MEAAGPLCILLQHLKKDPQAVQVGEAINLVLKSLLLLGHAVATVSKYRRQDVVKSTHITDITELGKHFNSTQKLLLANLKPRNLTLLVSWLKKFPRPSSLSIGKPQAERILVEATVHQTPMGRMILPLTQPARFLQIKTVKVFTRKSLTLTTGLFGGPPPKESLSWGGGGRGRESQRLTPGRGPTSSPCMLPTGATHKKSRGKPSFYSFTFPSPVCLHQLKKHSEGRGLKHFLQNWELLTSDQWTLNN